MSIPAAAFSKVRGHCRRMGCPSAGIRMDAFRRHCRPNMAFHPDERTVVIANQDAGNVSVVDLEQGDVLRTVPAGVGIETLSFF